jgi:phenylpropionate dioxygenase-like ring-hydroxylating dioxygenase large terminal subunit
MPVVRHGARRNTSRFQCPYHRWTYGLDGQLNQALYMEENRSFDMQKVRLPEYRCEIWHGLIWVNLDDDAEPFAPRVADLDEPFAAFDMVGDDWVNPYPYDEVWPANWKLCVENNEPYHTMGVHINTLEPYVPTQNCERARYGEYWSLVRDNYATDRKVTQDILKRVGWKPGQLGQDTPRLDIFVIFPANAFTISPGGAGWFAHWPISLEKTRAFMGSASPPDQVQQVDDPRDSGLHKVLNEDRSAYERGIQQGTASRELEAGSLCWIEENVFRAHQWTARRLLEAVG